jgi:hypothetical protein
LIFRLLILAAITGLLLRSPAAPVELYPLSMYATITAGCFSNGSKLTTTP